MHRSVQSARCRRLAHPGYPYLRTDRFTASFRDQVLGDDEKFQAWTARLRALDAEARTVELHNLPEPSLQALDMSRDQAGERSGNCSGILARHDLAEAPQRAQLATRAQVPDDYITWQRTLGLYLLTKVPFSFGIDDWREEAVEDFRKSAEGGPEAGALSRYMPAGEADRAGASAAVAQATADVLGIPQLSAAQLDALFTAHAPVIEVETTGAFDRIGVLACGAVRRPRLTHPRRWFTASSPVPGSAAKPCFNWCTWPGSASVRTTARWTRWGRAVDALPTAGPSANRARRGCRQVAEQRAAVALA